MMRGMSTRTLGLIGNKTDFRSISTISSNASRGGYMPRSEFLAKPLNRNRKPSCVLSWRRDKNTCSCSLSSSGSTANEVMAGSAPIWRATVAV
eukprot:3819465-Pyramimonas_sp.AAC.1